ncbi:MAG TPA: ricin-type beta-trefoil lectin domain protein [Micromonosporaceae bacterium]|nr:ricin-type beta-trefoil lectin domain protein [Micromonosporaceae bacterium]
MRGTAHRRIGRLVGAAAVAAVMVGGLTVAITGTAHAESNGGVRIMPLGDSITDGYNVRGGYRIELWQKMVAGRYTVDFVGSGFNGPASLGDHDHEGHSGWRIDQLNANIVTWLRATTPRTVLLHIGTNDVIQNYDLANAPGRLSGLIDRIISVVPNVELFVSTITPLSDATRESRARTFNAAIPGIVRQKVSAGHHVHLVDMHAAVTTADLADGIHPNAGGYAKMATVWYNALRAVPASLTAPSGTTTGRLANAQYGTCLDVTGANTAPGTTTVLWTCHTGANQQWTRTAAGELRVFGSSCLDVSGGATAAGSRVIIYTCKGSSNQKWTVRADGTILGVGSNRCLAPVGTGTAMQLADCSTAASQRWTVQ